MYSQELLSAVDHSSGKLEIYSSREGKELYCICTKNGYTKQFIYNSFSEFGENEKQRRLEEVKQLIIKSENLNFN